MTNQTKWIIDQSHSEIAFKIKHLMIANINGSFKTFDANIYTTSNDFTTAQIDLWIDVSSINTGDEKRDAHLKGSDFFDIENHKQISFIASSIGKADSNNEHELWGEFTMRGINRNVKLNVQFGGLAKDPWGNEKAGFTVTGKINRSDWGLTWNAAIETGGLMVSDEINISCEIQLTKVSEQELTMELLESDGMKK